MFDHLLEGYPTDVPFTLRGPPLFTEISPATGDGEMKRLSPRYSVGLLSAFFGNAGSPKGKKLGSLRRNAILAVIALIVGVMLNVETYNQALGTYIDVSTRHVVDSIPPTEVLYEKHCKALVLNQEYNCHYEVLESILALYPLPQLPYCNRSRIKFTFAISTGEEREIWRERSASWYDYATQSMTRNEYTEFVGQSRVLEKVIRNSSRPTTRDYDYQIGASCYCHKNTDVRWLLESETHFCVFHETCERFANSSQAMWVNPKMKRSLFPSILPRFDHRRDDNHTTHNLCVIGSVERREYRLVLKYLSDHLHLSRIQFHHFGVGKIKPRLKRFVILHSIPNYTEFQLNLYRTCDAILSLVTRSGHPEYFKGPTKLSGAVVQAAAYRKPILLHKDLATVYHKHLVHVETHRDDYESFSAGLNRLLNHLTMLKATGNANSSVSG
ncbi:hypothetical protein MHU86_15884 [Fragilaria crotonensis]|nr:hypothetical protein MHU86_15884 [Fragilaria crotonensis]